MFIMDSMLWLYKQSIDWYFYPSVLVIFEICLTRLVLIVKLFLEKIYTKNMHIQTCINRLTLTVMKMKFLYTFSLLFETFQ